MHNEPKILFDKNLSILKDFIPENLYNLFKETGPNITGVVGSLSDGNINLLNDQAQPLYFPNAIAHIDKELSSYIQNPKPISFSDDINIDSEITDYAKFLASEIQSSSRYKYEKHNATFEQNGFLICFGCGLGLHLPFLAQKLNVETIILVEENLRYILNSLSIFDWTPFLQFLKIKQRNLHLIIDDRELETSYTIQYFLKDKGVELIEGSYYFSHYGSNFFKNVQRRLEIGHDNLISYNGWVEDEMIHLSNHIQNMHLYDYYLIEQDNPLKQDSPLKDLPAIVVGSGQSLDDAISYIKNNRANLVIYSCGSALKPLLAAGIHPDFHCELENVSVVADIFESLSKQYDLSAIRLIASTTINPDAAAYFDTKYFFLREGTGIPKAIAQNRQQMNFVAPSGTNTAIRIADILGHDEIYLVGVDYGIINQHQKYAKDVIYNDFEKINNKRQSKGLAPIPNGGAAAGISNRTLPGNLGGTVKTNSTLLYMKSRLEITVQNLDATVYNCGHGALIENVLPVENEIISQFRASTKETLSQQLDIPIFRRGELLNLKLLEEIQLTYETILDNFHAKIQDLCTPTNQHITIQRIRTIFQDILIFDTESQQKSDLPSAIRSTLTGSYLRIFHAIRYYGSRLNNVDQSSFYLDALQKIIAFSPLIKARTCHLIEGYRTQLKRSLEKRSTQTDITIPLNKPISLLDYYLADHEKTAILWKTSFSDSDNEKVYTAIGMARYTRQNFYSSDLINLVLHTHKNSPYDHNSFLRILAYIQQDPNIHKMEPYLVSFMDNLDSKTPFIDNMVKLAIAANMLHGGKINKAKSKFELALQYFPSTAHADGWRATHMLISGKLNEAGKLYEEWESQQQHSLHNSFHGLYHYISGNIEAAFEKWSQSLPTDHQGGTGASHFFAISVANELKMYEKEKELLVSAENKSLMKWQKRATALFHTVVDIYRKYEANEVNDHNDV
ncbi:6-hydroxymethylpterin diphosphokinase MptE-like protein [Curvivirga sp.]|uniref:motility associated factor glycosyltransferase family protein n=1 Tax=Curvivirga sp. TaxID=2856848 RepID=UPI003B596843